MLKCCKSPLLTGNLETKVIEVIAVSELHLLSGKISDQNVLFITIYLTGIVGKLLQEIERKVFPSKEYGKTLMDNFLKKVIFNI